MSVIHAPQEAKVELRQLIVPGLVTLAFCLFGARIWYLQVVRSEDLRDEVSRSGEISVSRLAPRGEIVDRAGMLIAGVRPTWVITAIPAEVKKSPDGLARAAEILGVPPEQLQERLDEAVYKSLPTVVFEEATLVQATRIAEYGANLPGFAIESRPLRKVTEPKSLAHLLGYVGKPNDRVEQKLKEEGIKPAEYVGRGGLEMVYERMLMGVAGAEKLAVDSRRRPVRQLGGEAPQPGSRLALTIDLDLQRFTQGLLSGRRAGAVAIDPKTGEILAIVSSPSYDLRLFEGGISNAQMKALNENPEKPLINRPIQGTYSPGSTFKIVTSLAAAREGLLKYSKAGYCPGYKQLGRSRIACNNHPAGLSMSFEEAFARSCNTYFIELALQVGPEKLKETAEALGLGQETGIDLPGENDGLVPNALTVRDGRRDRPWFVGDTANFGIGQGQTLVTPLQMADVLSVVANEGFAFKPHLVRSIQPPGPGSSATFTEPEQISRLEAPPEYWAALKRAMIRVVAAGTGRRAQVGSVVVGGKTGSTEHNGAKQTHAWFVGMAPMDNPRIAVAVLVESAGHGGDVAAPIAGQMIRRYLDSVKARESRSASAPNSAPADSASLESRPSARNASASRLAAR